MFGPEAYVAAPAEKFFAPGPQGIELDALSVYPSDPPGAADGPSPTSHGNGFVNTGLLDADGASPFPRAASVTFSNAGQLRVHLHGARPFMKGTITVP